MDATGTNGEIEVRLLHSNGAACISVIDNGGGLAPHDAQRVFQPFVTTKPEGIGLGLTSARRTAEAHGGTLSYRRLQQKTEFEIRLPILNAEHATPKEQTV
jgi:signal transduction histidine kinase